MEKSTFLKPESRKMFRPILPNVPLAGGVMTDLPLVDTKQPSAARLPASAALAEHNVAAEELKEEGSGGAWPLTALVGTQLPPDPKPEQNGMAFWPDLKSAGFPLIFQRSVKSPPRKSFPKSFVCHGWGV